MQAVLAAFIRDGHLARHVRKMRAIYAERREAVLAGLRAMDDVFEVIPSEAGMHLAARIRDPARAARVMARVREFAPGAQATSEYAMGPVAPAVAFGYGVIDADEIRSALEALRHQLRAE